MATNDSASAQDQRTVWAFWIACGLTVVAGVAPLLLGGPSNRISAVVFPFAVAAIALAACAFLDLRGKVIVSLLYVLAGLAIAYGILATLATPLRLAVIGTCPPEPASCLSGLERPLTGGETTALGVVIAFGVIAMMVGYFGLFTVYRRHPVLAPSTPPVRRIAPVGSTSTETAPPAPAPAMVSAEAPTTSEPQRELPAPTPEEMSETPGAVATPTPERKPRRRRAPKVRPETPTEQNGGL